LGGGYSGSVYAFRRNLDGAEAWGFDRRLSAAGQGDLFGWAVAAEAGLLANDLDSDGDTLTAVLVSPPTNGTVTIGGDGAFTYTPDSGFSGTDTFTYVADDGSAASPETTVSFLVRICKPSPLLRVQVFRLSFHVYSNTFMLPSNRKS